MTSQFQLKVSDEEMNESRREIGLLQPLEMRKEYITADSLL